MMMDFDFQDVRGVEFGVGTDFGERTYCLVPVDNEVQDALKEMAVDTWALLQKYEPSPYDPSERYGGIEHIVLPLDHSLALRLREVHEATPLPDDSNALEDPTQIFCYFARLIDGNNRKITCFKRAAQFKGVLKQRLITFITDALRIIDDTVFKLDKDFDIIVDSASVRVLRPSGLEYIAQLQEAILAAVPQNIQSLQHELPFIDFEPIEAYARTRPRMARALAAIRSQAKGVDKDLLLDSCVKLGVDVEEKEGKLVVKEGHIAGLLDILDRRLYKVHLIKDAEEQYRASRRVAT